VKSIWTQPEVHTGQLAEPRAVKINSSPELGGRWGLLGRTSKEHAE